MLTKITAKPVSAADVKAMLLDGKELALIDVREELIFSQSHLLWARSYRSAGWNCGSPIWCRANRPASCSSTTTMVWRSAPPIVLGRAGYSDLHVLDGGVAAWEAAGYELFSGVYVPSKAFGEFVEHDSDTPSISADELAGLIRERADIVVLDSRPFDEFSRVSIPTGINVPGAELVLRARDLAPSPDTTVVVNCAGRTRSIIGAQSLINAGLPNKVVALRNGTMGFTLAGHTCDSGKDPAAPPPSRDGLAWAQIGGRRRGARYGVIRIDAADARRGFAPRRRIARSISSTCATRPNTRPVMSPVRCPRQADNSCRPPTSMSARSAPASCWWMTPRCAPS